ncbi:MAG: DUF1501 domain-containing protein [Verrucomicrobiaceae bacterium]|nr:DUF1501 domain-containing protein [Verrucomicrobiaceae bacterium]
MWCTGEYGRRRRSGMAESPWNGGGHHFGKCFSSLLAGGGFKGGQVLGKSNATGEEVMGVLCSPC